MLEVSGLSTGYDSHVVVLGVSVDVREGEAVAIIGSNGAGKTTFLRAICGLLPVSAGDVRYEGRSIANLAVHKVARAGISFVPAERHLFPEMSVAENLALGAFPNRPDPDQQSLVFDLFPRLAERRRQAAGTMSGGEQQMLAVGRALMSRPRLLILDEPTTGLAPRLASQAYESLAALRTLGMTILVAEQQVPLVLGLADRGYVLENGAIQLEGPSAELRDNPTVQRAYLGVV
ncbi:high-affinity branched-chain amino acid transport ATP-binding protein LivF [bacterium BMS3Bbin02]|nr:high-affinity branched-chain amino acid transport ATP-binding protein LivF [bacterium BMS3Bbin02]